MLNQFSRTELLIGKEGIEKLAKSRVAVFGIGGVGSYTVEALVRSGLGTIDIIDDDKVCITNLNRQLYATRKTVGKYKVDVAKERILDINPDCVVNTHQTFYTPETADQFDFSQYDYVVDKDDKVVRGNDKVKNNVDYLITLTRSMEDDEKIDKCPNCGASLDIISGGVCPYCDSTIVNKSNKFVMSKKECIGQRNS